MEECVCGGGEVGAETASHLALQERKVTIVEMRPELMMDMAEIPKNKTYQIFDEFRVKTYTEAKVVAISDDHVIIEQHGKELAIPTDNVVLAFGYHQLPLLQLKKALNSALKFREGKEMKKIDSLKSLAAIGPYSQAISASGTTVYVSGQLPINVKTGTFSGEFFKEPYPARAAFQVAGLLKEARVEIACTAVKKEVLNNG